MGSLKKIITQQDLRNSYNELKEAAYSFFKKGDFENSLKMIEGCARLAYDFNFVENFCDDELETLLVKIFQEIKGEIVDFKPETNRILFYDYFAIDNRGLTQQYLTALINADFDILFIVSNDLFYNSGNEIIRQLKRYNKCRIIIYAGSLTLSERILRLSHLIEEYMPTYIFLHLSPWDVIACATFPNYNSAKKLFINLTDHAFWIGKNCFDICLDFRNYGYQINKELRKIKVSKLLILPYYPIIQSTNKFLGLPKETEGKVIGLSGGSGYKFIGDNWRFYNLISNLLHLNKNFIFLLVGTGGMAESAFRKKIKKDNLEERFLLLPDRYDIFQLISHIDIYFGSYPFPGGLMTQLACVAGKPILTIISDEKIFSRIDDVITFRDEKFTSYKDDISFIEVASKMIQNPKYREQFASLTNNKIISIEGFNSSLMRILNGNDIYDFYLQEIGNLASLSQVMSDWFLEIENSTFPKFFFLMNSYFEIIKSNLKDTLFYETFNIKPIIDQRVRKIGRSLFLVIKKGLKKMVRLVGVKRKQSKLFSDLPFKSIGKSCDVQQNFIALNPKYISIGNNFSSLYNLRIEAWDYYEGERFHPEIIIGDNVCLNTDCHIGCIDRIYIGDNVLIASRVYISDHSHGKTDIPELQLPPIKRPLVSKGPVIIENNVWIGEGACILPNVRVGFNSIIGANAVVTRDVPPNSIVGGVPARIIKTISNG